MTILADAYLILDDLLGGIYGSAPPVIGALLAGWDRPSHISAQQPANQHQPASQQQLLAHNNNSTCAPAHALVQTNI